jgi:MYXO-CTERM domain-containing protein
MRQSLLRSLTVSFVVGLPSALRAQTPYHAITSTTSPLTLVAIGNEGSDQIGHLGDANLNELYPPESVPGDSGTFIFVSGVLYAPDVHNHPGGTATGGIGTFTPFTPVSQTATTGMGTIQSPYQIVTVYDAGASGIRVTQTDRYVLGQESYTTQLDLASTATIARNLILYRAGDCYLGGSDSGFGFADRATGSIACTKTANNMPADRVEQWLPISGGSHFYENHYSQVWTWIGSHRPFDDTCECATSMDNGAGLSWEVAILPGGSVTRAHVTTFSSIGALPVTTQKTADTATVTSGAMDGYTMTLANPNTSSVGISAIMDQLPLGFAYQPGSTTGLTTADPRVNGQMLTWNGPFAIMGQQTVMLHFGVTVATATGTYFNNAAGVATNGITVSPTGDTAPVHVVASMPDGGVNTDAAGFDGTVGDGSIGADGGATMEDGAVVGDGGADQDSSGASEDASSESDAGAELDSGSAIDSGASPGGGRDAAMGGSNDGSSGARADAGGKSNDKGCSCAAAPRDGGRAEATWLAWALLALIVLPRRRTR